MEERRKSRRSRTYLRGQIVFNRRTSTIDCLVRNLCGHGARIEFADGTAIPSEFDLSILRFTESRRANIVWRNETAAGVVFLRAASEKFVSLEAARRIRRLEAERDTLKQRVADLGDLTL